MRLDIITLFPEMFAPLYTSIPARAQKRDLVELGLVGYAARAFRTSYRRYSQIS